MKPESTKKPNNFQFTRLQYGSIFKAQRKDISSKEY